MLRSKSKTINNNHARRGTLDKFQWHQTKVKQICKDAHTLFRYGTVC